MDLSVVIVNWNAEGYLMRCLDSVFNGMDGISHEVIVVDNASADGSVMKVREKFPSVILLENRENSGYGKANNQGIRKSNGRNILILNPDTIVMPGSIGKLVRFIDANKQFGAAGPKILNPDKTAQYECARNFPSPLTEFFVLTTLYKRFPKSRIFGSYLMTYWDHNDSREVDLISGACMLIKKEVFDAVGLFDENFFMYTEETDLFYRIRKAGWKVQFLSEAEIIHFWGKSTEQLPYAMAVEARKTMEQFFRKHYGVGAVICHRLAVITASAALQGYGILLYLFSKSNKRSGARDIVIKNNRMMKWAVGLK